MTIDEYRTLVDRLARERTGESVLNGSFSHASVINECMFRHSEHSIDILARRFDPKIFGTDLIVQVYKKISQAGTHKIRILIEETDGGRLDGHSLLSKMINDDNAIVRRVPETIANQVDVNFTIMDGNSYRFEKNKCEATAVAVFGDREGFADVLKDYFDSIWNMSEQFLVN